MMPTRLERDRPETAELPDSVMAVERIVAALGSLPFESLEQLAPHLTPSAIRRRRDAERNACYCELATGLPHPARELARAIATELDRYQHGRWRFEQGGPPPADARRALMHRILTLDGGRILSASSLRRRVLVGIAGAKSADFLSQQPR